MDEAKRNINTAGGDAGRDIDKRQGNFTERDFYGTSVYANHGTITNFFETQKRIAQAEFCRIGLPEQIYQQSLIHREEVLQKLAEVVLQTDGPRLTVLHGMPGIGKTSLLAQFTRSISEEQFNNGVLWGNLDLLAPHELLSRFLALLPEESGITSTRLDASLRDVFWKRLCGNGAKWLVIIDHVRDRQQLTELLPGSEEILGQSRICLIAHEPFELYLGESQATIHEIKSLTPKGYSDL